MPHSAAKKKHRDRPPLPDLPLEQSWDVFKAQAVDAVASFLEHRRETIRQRFMDTNDATITMRALSDLMDEVLIWLCDQTSRKTGREEHMAVIALGGYGRQEMFPFSDVDLLFLHAAKDDQTVQLLIETMLYVLWDAGLKLGHTVHNIQDIHRYKDDVPTLTSWLDARLLIGEKALFDRFHKKIFTGKSTEENRRFVHAKLEERERRHASWGDSRYVLEPNIKDGKGGLRDLQTLYWIAKFVYDIEKIDDLVALGHITPNECHRYHRAENFLRVVRMHMHYSAGRAEERLTFEIQRHIAQALGFRGNDPNTMVERFMKRYFLFAREEGYLTNLICTGLEVEQLHQPRFSFIRFLSGTRHLEEFIIEGNRLTVEEPDAFARHPIWMLKLFYLSVQHKVDIHPHTLKLVFRNLKYIDADLRENEEANELFLTILLDTEHGSATLMKLKDAGVLARFIPEFARIICQMQFDMYHIYTVDEHTLVALSILHAIEAGKRRDDLPLACEVISKVTSTRVLHLAMMCHDIAKGMGGDHARNGEIIAKRLAERFGFSASEQSTIGWLVRHHIAFSDVAFKRDLSDAMTIRTFAEDVQSLEKLRLLLVMTVADIQAVGPNVWNGWKGALMRELYYRTEHFMQTGSTELPGQLDDDIRSALAEHLPKWKQEAIDDYMEQCPPEYLYGCSATEHATVASLLKRAEQKKQTLTADMDSNEFHDMSIFTLCIHDRKGLLADVAAALSLTGVNIAGARIATLKNGWAVQRWMLQDHDHHALNDVMLDRLMTMLKHMEDGTRDVAKEVASQRSSRVTRAGSFDVPAEIFVENQQSMAYSIVEVIGPDCIGLLHTICRTIQEQRLNIASAHINTYGEQAVDVFYVKDDYGFKMTHQGRIEGLKKSLIQAIAAMKETTA